MGFRYTVGLEGLREVDRFVGVLPVIVTVLAFALACSGPQTAHAQSNTFNDRINARAGIDATGDITQSTGTLRSPEALLYGLTVNSADATNPVEIGDPTTGRLQLYMVETSPGFYHAVIRSTTNIPLRLDGINDAVEIVGGANITDGTTRIDDRVEITGGPVSILNATDPAGGLHLNRSRDNATGLRVFLNESDATVRFTNNQPGASGFVFDPPLSNIGGATSSIAIYADHLTMSATDSTLLTSYISTALDSVAWDELLDASGSQTVSEYVQGVSSWIVSNWDQLRNATGTLLPDYIDDRVANQIASVTNIFASTITVGSLSITSATATQISVENLLVNGIITLATTGAVIGWPTEEINLDEVNLTLDWHQGLISNNRESITALQGQGSADLIVEVTDTVAAGANEYLFTLPEWNVVDASFYQTRFVVGFPHVESIGFGADYSPYVVLLPGATVDSHRGFRLTLSDGAAFSRTHELRIQAKLEEVPYSLRWLDIPADGSMRTALTRGLDTFGGGWREF